MYSRQDLLTFIDAMVKAKYRVQSIHTILRSVHALCHANNLEWPLDQRDLYIGVAQDAPNTPMLTLDEITKLICGAKTARFPDMQLTILATLYGFRNRELAAIITEGLDGTIIDIQTAKMGRRRRHQIPAPLAKALAFRGKSHESNAAHKAFERIMERYVRPPKPREGWHSIRRNVVTVAVDGRGRADIQAASVLWFVAKLKGLVIAESFAFQLGRHQLLRGLVATSCGNPGHKPTDPPAQPVGAHVNLAQS